MAQGKPTMLFFSQRFPFPLDTGGKIRTAKMLEYLRDEFDITLVSNFEPSKDSAYLDHMPSVCHRFVPVVWREVRRYSLRFYARVLIRCLSRYPVVVCNDHSSDLQGTLEELVKHRNYDLLVCDFLTPALNFSPFLGTYRTLLFEHNVESMIFKRHFVAASNPLLKLFWLTQWKKMVKFETEMGQRFTAVVAVSDVDRNILARDFGIKNVHAVPTGVDTNYFAPCGEPADPLGLVFVGSMDWPPNEDGILWFLKEVWPQIKELVPGVTFTVVGRNPSRKVREVTHGMTDIQIAGKVSDVRPYIARHGVYVVPLRIGGGTRIKIYEAMAMGKAVVSTRVGAEGLPVKHGEHLLLADTPKEMAETIAWLISNAKARVQLEKAARRFVESNVSWKKAASIFAGICRDTIENPIPTGTVQ